MKTIRNLLLSAIMALCGSVFSAGAQEDAGKGLADVPMVKLNNGVLMPRFGLGTFLQGSDEEMQVMRSLNKEQRFFNITYEPVQQFGMSPMKD